MKTIRLIVVKVYTETMLVTTAIVPATGAEQIKIQVHVHVIRTVMAVIRAVHVTIVVYIHPKQNVNVEKALKLNTAVCAFLPQ